METKDRFIRMPELLKRTGLSAATIYRLEDAGQFPSRRKLGANSVAWLESEVLEWIHSRQPAIRKVNSTIGPDTAGRWLS